MRRMVGGVLTAARRRRKQDQAPTSSSSNTSPLLLRGGAILGQGTFGVVHTMDDLLLAPDFQENAMAVVRAVVIPADSAPHVVRRVFRVDVLVQELEERAVYKHPKTGGTMEPEDDSAIIVEIASSLAMASTEGLCGRDGPAMTTVMPFLFLDATTAHMMPVLATSFLPFPIHHGMVVVIVSLRVMRPRVPTPMPMPMPMRSNARGRHRSAPARPFLSGGQAIVAYVPLPIYRPFDPPYAAPVLGPVAAAPLRATDEDEKYYEDDGHSEMPIFVRMQTTLHSIDKLPGSLRAHDIIAMLRAVLDSLALLACTGANHMDIKPANILATRTVETGRWRFMLTDFGLAKWRPTRLEVVGTPAFMSPLLYLAYHEAEGRQKFLQTFEGGLLPPKSPWWPESYAMPDGLGVTGHDVWDSYDHEIESMRSVQDMGDSRADEAYPPLVPQARRDKYKFTDPISQALLKHTAIGLDMTVSQKAELQRLHTKNDLFAIGLTLARYRPSQSRNLPDSASSSSHIVVRRKLLMQTTHDVLFGYAIRLMMGGTGGVNKHDNGIWTIMEARSELTRLHALLESGMLSTRAQTMVADAEGGGPLDLVMVID